MTREEIQQQLQDIMGGPLEVTHMDRFSTDARLNEDLYLDSVMVLQLIVHIELSLLIEIPDEMLDPKAFHTVGSLTEFLYGLQAEEERS